METASGSESATIIIEKCIQENNNPMGIAEIIRTNDKEIRQLLDKAKPAAQNEFQKLEQFAKDLDGIERLEKWDSGYYSEKLKQKLFSLDDEQLKPYFKLENVITGAFTDENGFFSIPKVPRGKVIIKIESELYSNTLYPIDVVDARGILNFKFEMNC